MIQTQTRKSNKKKCFTVELADKAVGGTNEGGASGQDHVSKFKTFCQSAFFARCLNAGQLINLNSITLNLTEFCRLLKIDSRTTLNVLASRRSC